MHEYGFLHFPPAAIHVDSNRLQALPQSARIVFDAVCQDGPLSHSELRVTTGMAPRTIRFAVNRLRELELIDAVFSLHDCRTCYFYVHKDLIDPEAIEEARRKAQDAARNEGKTIEQLGATPPAKPATIAAWRG